MASNSEVISTLNHLIETCRDGQQGFLTAAEGVQRGDLKQLFHGYSQQRAGFVGQLQDEVRRLGGEAEDSGSVAASLHRGWIDIKSAVTGHDDNAIIAECERGEDSAVRNYKDALTDESLPSDVRTVVERQYAAVQAAHDRIRSLERATGAAGA